MSKTMMMKISTANTDLPLDDIYKFMMMMAMMMSDVDNKHDHDNNYDDH